MFWETHLTLKNVLPLVSFRTSIRSHCLANEEENHLSMTDRRINLMIMIIAFALLTSRNSCHESECEVKFNESLQNLTDNLENLEQKYLDLQQQRGWL